MLIAMAVFEGRFQKVVFIVSSGRTGTTALARHLDTCYEQVCALHEPKPSWRLRRASGKALSGRMQLPQLVELLARSRRKLVESIREPIYIESNPYLGGFVEAFGQVFENPMMIHVVRDPRTFVRSSMNFGAFRGLKKLANLCIPYWLPKPDYLAGHTLRWRKMSEPQRMAWYWSIINRAINRGQERYGDRYLRIRFEDLFAADGSGLQKLTDWIGLPRCARLSEDANREQVNASRERNFPKWADWDEQLKTQLLEYCGELMDMYGYDRQAEMKVARGLAVAAGAGDNARP